jgi:hypothetical protein
MGGAQGRADRADGEKGAQDRVRFDTLALGELARETVLDRQGVLEVGGQQRWGVLQQPHDACPQFPGVVVGLHQLLHDATGRVGERGDRRHVCRACLQGGKDGLVDLGDQGQGRATPSLVAKQRKNVRGATSAASAISATVVSS